MSYSLFLDDVRSPSWVHWPVKGQKLPPMADDAWVIVRDFDAFVEQIKSHGCPDFVSFDHDLDEVDEEGKTSKAAGERTGMDCAKWLVEWCMDQHQALPRYAVHSQNPAGTANIDGLLRRFAQFQSEEGLGAPKTPGL